MWQLNEIWPTGGWGSLEYGTPVKGQVIGGRWKPLHHMMEQSAYTDVTAACGKASITVTADNARSPAPHRIARRLTHCWRLLDARHFIVDRSIFADDGRRRRCEWSSDLLCPQRLADTVHWKRHSRSAFARGRKIHDTQLDKSLPSRWSATEPNRPAFCIRFLLDIPVCVCV